MWHKKILTSINISHYLNDVFKLEGDQLTHTTSVILGNPSLIYEHYCRQYPENTGTLARAIKKSGAIPSDYIEPPLTYAIDEIAWAITHGYVHPREVVVIKYKDTVALLKAISNDILKTLLSNEGLDNDPKLMHYLETELNIREATNVEDFEDFEVKPANNEAYANLKVSSGLEAKAAKLLFTPKPVQEAAEESISSGAITFRNATTYRRNVTDFGNSIAQLVESGDAPRLRVTALSSADFIPTVSEDPVIRNYPSSISTRSGTIPLTYCIVFKIPGRLIFVKISTQLRSHLLEFYPNLVRSSCFTIAAYRGQSYLEVEVANGYYDNLITFGTTAQAILEFEQILGVGELRPASGVVEDSDDE